MKFRTFAAATLCTSLVVAQGPPNDECGYSIYVTLPALVSGSNVGATLSMPACGSIGSDVWYRFVAPYNGTVTLSVCSALGPGSTTFDSVIAVRLGACGFPIVGCNDDYCSQESWLQVPITAGTEYEVQLGGFQGAQGSFTLSIVGTPTVPPNDACANAIPLTVGALVVAENFGATTGPDPTPFPCNSGKDVWYVFAAPACGTYSASTCTGWTGFDTVVTVWQGSCGSLSQVACSDDNCPGGFITASYVTFYADAGSTRYLSVGGFAGGNLGQFGLLVSPVTNTAMSLGFFDVGPGTLGFSVTNGPSGGYAFTAITLNQGAYPSGWFAGIDIGMPDLLAQWMAGPPFVLPLSAPCGNLTFGPVPNVPGGLTLFAVAHGFPSGSVVPSKVSPPATMTVP
jgi:hypothetical protein